jgi:Ribosome biogenesis protein SLX9
MPKIKKLRRHKVENTAQPYSDPNVDKVEKLLASHADGNVDAQSASLSRGQRKRQVRKDRIMMKMGKVVVKTTPQQDGNIHSTSSKLLLSELESTLTEAAESATTIRPSASSTITSNKMKKEIAVREATRMKLVQQHPAFQADPLGALKTHLEQMTAIRQAKLVR